MLKSLAPKTLEDLGQKNTVARQVYTRAHQLEQQIVRGAREAKALPEEQRSRPFLHRGRKLKSLWSRVLVLGKRTKCSKKYCTTRGDLHKALSTTICTASSNLKDRATIRASSVL